MMDFNFRKKFRTDRHKWELFDIFLSDLAAAYPKEFSKPLYTSGRFLTIIEATDPYQMVCEFPFDVPEHIAVTIQRKLNEIFPVE